MGPNPTSSLIIAGWSSLVARRAHNPKVIGSNPIPAIWSLSVVVITPPCHGGDHRSESGRDRNGSIAQLVEQRIEAPLSAVRFRLAPFWRPSEVAKRGGL